MLQENRKGTINSASKRYMCGYIQGNFGEMRWSEMGSKDERLSKGTEDGK